MPYQRPRPSPHQLAVKRSAAGLGLFTTSPITKDTFVVEYAGPLLNENQADAKGGKYLFALDEKQTIDGSGRNNLARYINHSCRPNCEPEIDGRRVFIYATKNIKPDEELTYHYGKEYFEGLIKPHACRCPKHRRAPRQT